MAPKKVAYKSFVANDAHIGPITRSRSEGIIQEQDQVQQLQDMTTNSIRVQYGGSSQTSFMYFKPYTKRIDNLRMPP
ncbi:ty3-gypsy retrotransposon protein [Cucumis melo var. makuwa]|uniref:Ty3-gypsy retrotransposon protein n=1 Tax=Cucumis melo var. makuwa TaxID=1194695 RepID=A0A5D3BZ34_CUCMM|nr:ty3-gypsy retrotransposon protein [Cucumis melo var. makuwa]